MDGTPYTLPSISYEPAGNPSLFDQWEAGDPAVLQAPLSVHDASYREVIVGVITALHQMGRRTLVGVGSGNGVVEAELSAAGWDVLATDCAESALRCCRSKGLEVRKFNLMNDDGLCAFDVIYCDGVMGHLWQPGSNSVLAWRALARLGRPGSFAVVSNDLADSDRGAQFAVHASTSAQFYRPPAGSFATDACSTSLWSLDSTRIYSYRRHGDMRRREILLAQLLMNERIEPNDRP